MQDTESCSVPEQGPTGSTCPTTDFMEQCDPLLLQGDGVTDKDSPRNHVRYLMHSQSASQTLWSTGILSDPIPNGFYSVMPDKSHKENFDRIPTFEELLAAGQEFFNTDIILVDVKKDKKLSMLKQLIKALVKGLGSNPVAVVKKIAGLVSEFYKRPTVECSTKGVVEENSCPSEDHGIKLLGQIRHGSCHPRAILFKVLADTVGLESKLMVGLPNDGGFECLNSCKHMSVFIVLNSVELMVDLMRFPGQLIPRSAGGVFMTHISTAGESDSAENDSCDSPLEPNSPLYGLSERLVNNDLSRSEPNITQFFGHCNRRAVAERVHATSRFDDLSVTGHTLRRRRSLSMTPEISDDIVRAVRAMTESLKQGSLVDQNDNGLELCNNDIPHHKHASNLNISRSLYSRQLGYAHKAISLPSSPQGYMLRNCDRILSPTYFSNDELFATWNKVLESPMFENAPLLPFQAWNIDFSELTVGTRVGIGSFAEVFRGIWNGTDVAIKIFLEQDLTEENMLDFCNEISVLSRLRHPNVILFLGACIKPPHLSMVTEYMEMGSLYYLIHLSSQKNRLSWRRRLKILRDICRGLMCMHRMKIVHRDLKSANCLVNKHWTVKICDFGLSRQLNHAQMGGSTSAGTPEWMAPELLRNEAFTEKCDIFSLGVIMWELCTLSKPWDGWTTEKVVHAVANEGIHLDIPNGPLGRLISDCWAEQLHRPSCEEILSRLVD